MLTPSKSFRTLVSISIAAALVSSVGALHAQQTQAVPAALNIVVVDGEGAVNNIRQPAREPVVRVEDEKRQAVKGAAVVFTLPTEGATGEFHNGSKTLTTVTGADGIAKGVGLKVFRLNGKLPIHVTASYRGLTARTLITQVVEGAPPGAKVRKGGSGKIIAILAIIGAGAAGGGYYAYTANKTTSAPSQTPSGPTPIGINPGTGTIAPPR